MQIEQDIKSVMCSQKDGKQLTDKELNKVDGGKGEVLCCPKCGNTDIFWNPSCGFWYCNKCNNVFR